MAKPGVIAGARSGCGAVSPVSFILYGLYGFMDTRRVPVPCPHAHILLHLPLLSRAPLSSSCEDLSPRDGFPLLPPQPPLAPPWELPSPAPADACPLPEPSPGAALDRHASPLDHPIFSASIRLIRAALEPSGALQGLSPVQQDVLERLVHSSGDLTIAPDLRFSTGACERGLAALAAGAVILTDTAMAAAAVAPMARRTFGNAVRSVLDWAPATPPPGGTRAAAGMAQALAEHPGAVVLIGSAPTALEVLLRLVAGTTGSAAEDAAAPSLADPGLAPPALVIGMPVGFVGVAESKAHLAASVLPQIRLEGSRGGAGLVGAAANALLRRAWLDRTGV